jgi:hypothetical protein
MPKTYTYMYRYDCCRPAASVSFSFNAFECIRGPRTWCMSTAPAQRLARHSSASEDPAIACDDPTHCYTSAPVSARTLHLTWFPTAAVGGSDGLSTNARIRAHTRGSRVCLACRSGKALLPARSDQVTWVVTWLRAK